MGHAWYGGGGWCGGRCHSVMIRRGGDAVVTGVEFSFTNSKNFSVKILLPITLPLKLLEFPQSICG
jgi:hypothetical protein